MVRISKKTKTKYYHKIFDQIYENHIMTLHDIAVNTRISRNTVSKYIGYMYAKDILTGPFIRMNPAPNYKEHIYLMNFENPFKVFNGLKGFPHVLYHAMTFGDWNTMVITDRPLDFSQLVGFQEIVIQKVSGFSYTPKVEHTTWDKSFEKARELVAHFTPEQAEPKERRLAPFLDWGENQWKLYHAFKHTMRRVITPTLRKIEVRYEPYMKWMKSLETHCTIHTGFYPGGYYTYMIHCFLFSSDYESTLKSVFASFPTTPLFTEMGDQLLVFTSNVLSDLAKELFCTIYDMKEKEIITEFNQAVVLFQLQH